LKSIAIIGLGRVGLALAVLLWRQGWTALRVYDRNPEKVQLLNRWIEGVPVHCGSPAAAVAESSLVFLAVQDRNIKPLALALAASQPAANFSGIFFAHLSGALTSLELSSLQALGASTFSLHPLQSLADPAGAIKALPGSFFSFEGDERALPLAEELVRALSGHLVRLAAEDKVLYHAAAVVSSNFFIALEGMAISMMAGIGVDENTARRMLLPLIRGSFENLERVSPAEALTGPIVRGDDATIRAHLEALRRQFPDYLKAYRLLAGLNLELAMRRGRITPADFPSLEPEA